MKVFNVGETPFGVYEDMKLEKAKKATNKYGTFYYLKERIYLVHNKQVSNYSLWTGENGGLHLALDLEDDLKAELKNIMDNMQKQHP